MEYPDSQQKEATALSHCSPEGSSHPVLWRSGIAFLPVCRNAPRGGDVITGSGCGFTPVGQSAGMTLPARLSSQQLEVQEGTLGTGWLGVSLIPPFAALGSFQQANNMSPPGWDKGAGNVSPVPCIYGGQSSQHFPEMLNALPNFNIHKPDYFV